VLVKKVSKRGLCNYPKLAVVIVVVWADVLLEDGRSGPSSLSRSLLSSYRVPLQHFKTLSYEHYYPWSANCMSLRANRDNSHLYIFHEVGSKILSNAIFAYFMMRGSILLSHIGSLLASSGQNNIARSRSILESDRHLYFRLAPQFLVRFPEGAREHEKESRKRKPMGNIKSCGPSKMEICSCRKWSIAENSI